MTIRYVNGIRIIDSAPLAKPFENIRNRASAKGQPVRTILPNGFRLTIQAEGAR